MSDEDLKELDDFIENIKDDLNTENYNNTDSIFNRDKFLLDMMIHAYEEDDP